MSRVVPGRAAGKWQAIWAQACPDRLGSSPGVGGCVTKPDLIRCTGELHVGNEERRKQHLNFAWFSWERSRIWKRETRQMGEKHIWGGMGEIHSPIPHMLI